MGASEVMSKLLLIMFFPYNKRIAKTKIEPSTKIPSKLLNNSFDFTASKYETGLRNVYIRPLD